jgi:hypothetical protein
MHVGDGRKQDRSRRERRGRSSTEREEEIMIYIIFNLRFV